MILLFFLLKLKIIKIEKNIENSSRSIIAVLFITMSNVKCQMSNVRCQMSDIKMLNILVVAKSDICSKYIILN